jgi:N2-acetyl-L-2,4-diaminobutanoate deacetylase
MNRMLVKPEAVDFESRGRRDYLVSLEHPTLWGAYLVPLTVIVGPEARAGRGLVATGSIHGNEYEGPVALKHLVREIRTEDVLGRIVLIPVLNVVAFKAGRRDSPDDGGNLNRAFPGDAGGSITSRIADFVTRRIFPQVHVVLDLHAGGQVSRFSSMVGMHDVADPAQKREMLETARGFGCQFLVYYQNLTPGLLTSHAETLGKISLGGEFGWGEALQAEGISMCRQGVLAAAVRHGQLRGPAPENRHFKEQIVVDTSDPSSSTLAAFDGHFEPCAPLGAKIARGERVGRLHDFVRIDDPPLEIAAPHDGYVVCQAWGARVFAGQVISQLGRVVR